MPKGKDYIWILVGIGVAMFVLPYVSSKLSSRKAA